MMKKLKFILSAVALACTFSMASAQQKPFSDGGFETNSFQSWKTWDNKVHAKAKIIDNRKLVRSGKHAMELTGGGLYQDFFLKKGDEVKVTFFTKNFWGRTSTAEVIYITGVKSVHTSVGSCPISTEKKYQENKISFTAEKPGRYRLQLSTGKGGGKFLIDDVSVEIN